VLRPLRGNKTSQIHLILVPFNPGLKSCSPSGAINYPKSCLSSRHSTLGRMTRSCCPNPPRLYNRRRPGSEKRAREFRSYHRETAENETSELVRQQILRFYSHVYSQFS